MSVDKPDIWKNGVRISERKHCLILTTILIHTISIRKL